MFSLAELAERLGARLVGDPDCRVDHVATLEDADTGSITFLANRKYARHLATTRASAVLVSESDAEGLNTNALVVRDPYVAYAQVAAWLYPSRDESAGIHNSACVDADAQVDPGAWIGAQSVIEAGAVVEEGAFIGPGCVVGREAQIGAHTRLVANVSICSQSRIGAHCILHPGAVIGADGFGLANDQGQWVKIPQVGRVILGDKVEVGANTCIDRGAIGDTVIEEGVKLDNLIQIGHNVHIGAHTAIAAGVAIAGSAHIGRHCAIGGCAGIVGHIEIADNTTITAMSMVLNSIHKPGVYSSGGPLEDNANWRKNFVRMKQLDDMARRLKTLEKKLEP
jgi:UDP-3-O-[3-hydroxymyristoyl] glucosamine N-acyltransferase